MNHLNQLVADSVKENLEIKEKVKSDENKPKDHKEVVVDSRQNKKRKIDDESTDEDSANLPRRRVMTMGEFKKRKRVMTKYQRELNKEREEEMFYAQVYDEDYEDSLADFVVDENPIFIDEQMSSDRDVNSTSAFLRDNPSFYDDECEEVEDEQKDGFSDSEEEKMYIEAKGMKQNDFYDGDLMSNDEISEDDDDFLEDDGDLSDSSEFRRNIRRRRNEFVFDEVSVDNLETDDLDDELELEEDNGSDLDSFITDNDEPTIVEDTEDEEDDATSNFNSSCFYKKKKKTKRVHKLLDSSDEENLQSSKNNTLVELSSSKNQQTNKSKQLSCSSNVLSSIGNRSLPNSPEKDHESSNKKLRKTTQKIIENKVQTTSNTILLDSEDEILTKVSKSSETITISKTLVIEDSDEEIKISTKTVKTNKFVNSDDELSISEDHFSPTTADANKLNESALSDDLTIENSKCPKFSSDDDDDSTIDSLNDPKYILAPKKYNSNQLPRDEKWFESKTESKKQKKMVESKKSTKVVDEESSSKVNNKAVETSSMKTKSTNDNLVIESDTEDESLIHVKSNNAKKRNDQLVSDDEESLIQVKSPAKKNNSEFESDDESFALTKKNSELESDDESLIVTKKNSELESDDESFINVKGKSKNKVFESDDEDDEIPVNRFEVDNSSTKMDNVEESIEYIFTDDEGLSQREAMNRSQEFSELDEIFLEYDKEDATLT